MAYNVFVNDKPVGTDEITPTVTYMRENARAVLHALGPSLVGNINVSSYIEEGIGDRRTPQYRYYVFMDAPNIRIRHQIIYGTEGQPLVIAYGFSADSGVNWDVYGTKTMNYTGSICTSTSWA